MSKQTFNPEQVIFEADEKLIEFTNYKYDQTTVNFQRSYVCLEGDWWD